MKAFVLQLAWLHQSRAQIGQHTAIVYLVGHEDIIAVYRSIRLQVGLVDS